jgi:hypothetical protein
VRHYSLTVIEPAEEATGRDHRPFVLGGELWQRPSRPTIISLAILAIAVAIPVRGLYKGTGSSMEEGFMLVFPRGCSRATCPTSTSSTSTALGPCTC